jgi:hypothetical protein
LVLVSLDDQGQVGGVAVDLPAGGGTGAIRFELPQGSADRADQVQLFALAYPFGLAQLTITPGPLSFGIGDQSSQRRLGEPGGVFALGLATPSWSSLPERPDAIRALTLPLAPLEGPADALEVATGRAFSCAARRSGACGAGGATMTALSVPRSRSRPRPRP